MLILSAQEHARVAFADGRGRRRIIGGRALHVEAKPDIADFDFVPVLNLRPAFHAGSIQIGVVPAAEVFQVEMPVALQDLRMVPADGGVVQNNLAVGMAAHHHPLAEKFQNLARNGPANHF